MKWEDKVKLIELSEQESKVDFLEYVISKLDEFDTQALEMFITRIELGEESILENIDLHLKIYEEIKDETVSDLRTSLRFAVYEMVMEDYINGKPE